MLETLQNLVGTTRDLARLPKVSIDLMVAATAENHPFFRDLTTDFYREATRRHRLFPLVGNLEYGFALCDLRAEGKTYLARLDSAARRNLKKAQRLGYRFERVDYNAHLDEVTNIHRSTTVRQGAMPESFLSERAKPHQNPTSKNGLHDYPYFGVFKDDVMMAYASCLVAGELCSVETIYGHADALSDGVVPLLFASIGDDLATSHPRVNHYAYGTYFGASESMKRFKRKFLFFPHRVNWVSGA